MYTKLCSFRNLELAFRKARRNKRHKRSVQEFELNLERNLLQLKRELETFTYKPRKLKRFVIRDPKTRVISSSHFRDRVVHHALINVIQPIFEKRFIFDSHANQLKKGSSKALERFDLFKRRVSENGRLVNKAKDNNMVIGYILKADIKHYFDDMDHEVLLEIIERRLVDENVIWLIKQILNNHITKYPGKGMPIGNLTSQFFANVYLNELDYFVKHNFRAKYYIRYADDFVVLGTSKEELKVFKEKINTFLKTIQLELHPDKSKIYPLQKGVKFLGYRVFYHHKLLRKSNMRKMDRRLKNFEYLYKRGEISSDHILRSLVSWMGYAQQANTHKLRGKLLWKVQQFSGKDLRARTTSVHLS